MLIIVLLIVCGVFGAYILDRHDKSRIGFLLGLILGPIGSLVAFLMRSNLNCEEDQRNHKELLKALQGMGSTEADRRERQCPFCAERVLEEARVCRFCNRDLEPSRIRP
jgi:uncharacterized membrane protein YeaQ/YmgE (transglycosylase-associated protein family)